MNYLQTLNKAKTLLKQKHHAQAVQAAASALGDPAARWHAHRFTS